MRFGKSCKLATLFVSLSLTTVAVYAQNNGQPFNPMSVIEWRYVGLTEVEDDGEFSFGGLIGVAAMNKACAAKYPGARVSSIREAYFRNDADLRAGWLVPGGPILLVEDPDASLTGNTLYTAYDSETGEFVSRTADGATAASSRVDQSHCNKYRRNTAKFNGPVTEASGAVSLEVCTEIRPAACSLPFGVPVSSSSVKADENEQE